MNREEIIRMIAEAIENWDAVRHPDGSWQDAKRALAEAILNLGICKECGGEAKYVDTAKEGECSCKGTGGEKMLKTQEDCDKCHEIRSVKV
mgnify:CR=1 FL=1